MKYLVNKHVEPESNPGSFSDFSQLNSDLTRGELIQKHSEALRVHALALAAKANITLEDLHDRKTDYNTSPAEA